MLPITPPASLGRLQATSALAGSSGVHSVDPARCDCGGEGTAGQCGGQAWRRCDLWLSDGVLVSISATPCPKQDRDRASATSLPGRMWFPEPPCQSAVVLRRCFPIAPSPADDVLSMSTAKQLPVGLCGPALR
jgi:hypothetical protein